jgi:transcriptional regulator with XRE-family HTH domain
MNATEQEEEFMPDPEVSECAKALKDARLKAGMSMAQMSKALGMPLTTYQHYESRYRKPAFLPDFVNKVLSILAARGVHKENINIAFYAPYASNLRHTPVGVVSAPSRDLPVRWQALDGTSAFYKTDGAVLHYVERPPFLHNIGSAFAIHMYGTSMTPRFEQGDLLYVDPTKPVTEMCYVAIELRDGQGMIGQYVAGDSKKVTIRQFVPAHKHEFKRNEIEACYRIVGVGEL